MKIFTIMVTLLILQHHVYAQATCGLTAGAAFANIAAKEGGVRMSATRKAGFTFGAFMNIPAGRSFVIQPAANFVQKGFKVKDDTDPEYTEKTTTTMNWIEVPLNLVYRSTGRNHIMVGAGPSISFAVSGKEKYQSSVVNETTKLKFGSGKEDDFRGSEFGANIMAGIELRSRFLVTTNYNFGLSNIAPKGLGGGKATTNYFALKVGYVFKGS